MKGITTAGFVRPTSIASGRRPVLKYLAVADLIADPAYKRPISGRGRKVVERIAETFSWDRFNAVIVAATENGRYAIIDGHHRATAAALAGICEVPCQIVEADQGLQELAAMTINRTTVASSRMASQAAAYRASEAPAVQLAEVCARADVEILRYPVPTDRQMAGQTMAIATIAQCLKHYGEETVITALQCVTQTTNNRPGALSARIIKALCTVLAGDPWLRDSGLTLLEIFDNIDLLNLAKACEADALANEMKPGQELAARVRAAVNQQVMKHNAKMSVTVIADRAS
jgi:hypothetical protein